MATALSETGRTFWSEWRFRRSLDVGEGSWFDTTLLLVLVNKQRQEAPLSPPHRAQAGLMLEVSRQRAQPINFS